MKSTLTLLIALLLVPLAALLAAEPLWSGCQKQAPSHGLSVQDGTLIHRGKPYRGMGMNYAQCFWQLLKNPENRDFVEGFRMLREDYDIPFIRFAASPYHPGEWKLYAENPEEYFRRMDLIVREAEKRGLGLIPSLFWWNAAVGDWCEEPLGEMGNPQSKTRAFYRKYAADFVSRYNNSPAIWGLEIGNEYLLGADLPKLNHLPRPRAGSKEPRTAADKLTRPMILDLYQDIHQTIRKIDHASIWHQSPYGRIESDWKKENGKLVWNVTVPPNTTATAYIPASSAEGVTESGKSATEASGVTCLRQEDDCTVFKLQSGRYTFQSSLK